MRLKKIALQGYKTFAQRTAFTFEEGITAIVGPNGSGKSNIADALRWVLGEQSYRTLRGRRSTDMIFAGSQGRARAGMAQAILTLDNTDGWLPIDFTEVEIGRRVYRSGDNEYLLNGQKVRLRDVQELLATSGLAERTYTIIGQGLIDQALSIRSEERRALFEEAAGISHYKNRRAETMRRLQDTRHNLERIHDILSEINPRLKSLRRQANRAKNYEQVAADLRYLLRIWYGFQWEKAKTRLRDHRRQALEAEKKWQGSRQALLSGQTGIDQLRRRLNQVQQQIKTHQSEREQVRDRHEQRQRQMAVLSERRTLLARQLTEIAEELPRLKAQQAAAQQELVDATDALSLAESHLAEQEAAFKQFNQEFSARQQEIDQAKSALIKVEQQHQEAQKRLAQAEGKVTQLQERLLEKSQGDDHAKQIAAAAAQAQQAAQELATAEKEAVKVKEKRKLAQVEQDETQRRLKKLQEAGREQEQHLNEAVRQLARLEARFDMLAGSGRTPPPAGEQTAVLGRLAAWIDIPAAHRAALDAALGTRLDALIVPDQQALWKLVEQGVQNESWYVLARPAVAIAAHRSAHRNRPAGSIAWADEVVTVKAELAPLAELLFGGILLVPDRETAFQTAQTLPAGHLAVAPDGFIVHAGGLVEMTPADPQHSILAREAARREAAEKLAAQELVVADLRREVETEQAALRAQQQQADQQRREARRLMNLEQAATSTVQHSQRALDRARQQHAYLQQQQVEAAAEVESIQQRLQHHEAAIQEQRSLVAQLAEDIKIAQAHLAGLPVSEGKQQRDNHRQKIETAQTIVSGRSAVVESRRATLHQIENQLHRQEERYQDLQARQKDPELAEATAAAAQLALKLEELDNALKPLQAQLAEMEKDLSGREDQLISLQETAHNLETHYTQAKVALSQQENQIEGLTERIRADLGLVALRYDDDQVGQTPLPIAEVVDTLPEVKELPDDIADSIQRYRGQLQRMGPVNPDAQEEYDETRNRSEFLTQQIEDLEKTEVQLREVIAELDELTSRAFAQTVEEVNNVFGEMFNRLFGGGSAQLVLTEPDDLTISGVDILARLPRRRQQGLALLSGGERSLTAGALIFALLKVNPPPFCVLDEVDAMLDEANVTRFRDALCELGEQAQVIVITHNRGTVQAAQTVYGISMGVDSTSQVISIRPEEYLEKH